MIEHDDDSEFLNIVKLANEVEMLRKVLEDFREMTAPLLGYKVIKEERDNEQS